MVFSQNGKLASQYFKQNNVSSVDYFCLDFYSQTVINNKYLYFIMVQPSRISPIDLSVTKPRLQKKNRIVWILFAKWLLAFIIVIRYEEHDQDGDSMIRAYG